ncbi:MAG: Gfo/Idh/MocA family oxidoreductase [bacterium]|nr:Gfo/Idh/MocA family oxidoreductase [bacterium]
MKICLAGEGAQGTNHMKALHAIGGVEVVSLAGGQAAETAAFAQEWNIPNHSLDLEESLQQPGVEAVILATPNHLHAKQVELALNMDKHVLVEIPMGLNLEEAQRVADLEEKTGRVCMVCHSLRYFPTHREVHRRVAEGELHLHHIISQTYFFRRKNTNALGKPRTWVDNLLWHHGCHIVDFVAWLFEGQNIQAWGQAGPNHPELGVPMDLTIGMRSADGRLASIVLSFNNHGPIRIEQRFIGTETTLLIDVGKASLTDFEGRQIPVEGNSHEIQDREFLDAIRENRKPLTSCNNCLPTMKLLDRIQQSIVENR